MNYKSRCIGLFTAAILILFLFFGFQRSSKPITTSQTSFHLSCISTYVFDHLNGIVPLLISIFESLSLNYCIFINVTSPCACSTSKSCFYVKLFVTLSQFCITSYTTYNIFLPKIDLFSSSPLAVDHVTHACKMTGLTTDLPYNMDFDLTYTRFDSKTLASP